MIIDIRATAGEPEGDDVRLAGPLDTTRDVWLRYGQPNSTDVWIWSGDFGWTQVPDPSLDPTSGESGGRSRVGSARRKVAQVLRLPLALYGAGAVAAEFAADLTGTAVMAADLSTAITPAADLTASATFSAALTTPAGFAADLAVTATLSADLLTPVFFAADLSGTATLTADLTAESTQGGGGGRSRGKRRADELLRFRHPEEDAVIPKAVPVSQEESPAGGPVRATPEWVAPAIPSAPRAAPVAALRGPARAAQRAEQRAVIEALIRDSAIRADEQDIEDLLTLLSFV